MNTMTVRCSKCGAVNRVAVVGQPARSEAVCGKCRTPLRAVPVIVTDESFQKLVAESSLPVLLDLWAPWCGPCRMMAPIIDELAAELAGRFLVAKVNTDENPRTAQRFAIQSIPTLLVLRGGREAARIVGGQPKAVILEKLREAL